MPDSHIFSDEVYLLRTKTDFAYARFLLSVPRRQFVEFKVQICSDAFVGEDITD